MKIKGGPKLPGGPDVTPELKPAGKAKSAGKSEAVRFQDRLAGPDAARPSAPAAATAGPAATSPAVPAATTEAIRAQLAAGQISRPEAIRRIIDAVATEGPGKSLSAAQRGALEEHLTRALEDDPTLAAKAHRLGGSAGGEDDE